MSHYNILAISTTQLQEHANQTNNKQLIKTDKITIYKKTNGRSQHEPNHKNY